ncbi:cytochrome b-c1 complex subunit 10 [Kockiozyma suomiensis]|uniref:cytochrome b-c1 complex subunit 10 n=1 Tax=Kockiozyma suomiensis TaxID=1337062 RepID=UPI0033437873
MATRITHKYNPTFSGFSRQVLLRWAPNLGLWGGAIGVGALFLLEPIPRVQNVILSKLPILGDYWVRPIDPADSPF